MNLASALIHQVVALQDFETWSVLRQDYLPSEFHGVYKVIDHHCEKFHKIPTFEELQLEVRDSATLEKICAIESVDIDVEPYVLLEYLKNEYAQSEILNSLNKYVDESVAFEDAGECVEQLHQIVIDVADKVDLEQPQERMDRIELFADEDELSKYLSLGLNREFDYEIQFGPRDAIFIGGYRGAGKTTVACNISNNVYQQGKSVLYFSIEMDKRQILQRHCSIGAGVCATRLKTRNLGITEWESVAKWWAARFLGGQERFEEYKNHRDFDKLHQELTRHCTLDPKRQIDIVYDPSLTLAKIRAEIEQRLKSDMELGVIIIDYMNEIKRSATPSKFGQYDWMEQVEVSKDLKRMAQDYEIQVVSPYQVDKKGEVKFSKAILNAVDAAYTLEAYTQEDRCMTFTCAKMRNGPMKDFTSEVDWNTLKIGPESALTPKERQELESAKEEEGVHDL